MLGEKMHYSFLRCGQSNQDTWRKIVQSQRFLKTKDSQFFCQQTNSIHKCNGCFLRGQVSTNGFKVFVPLP